MFGLNIYLNTSLNTYLENESGLSSFSFLICSIQNKCAYFNEFIKLIISFVRI